MSSAVAKAFGVPNKMPHEESGAKCFALTIPMIHVPLCRAWIALQFMAESSFSLEPFRSYSTSKCGIKTVNATWFFKLYKMYMHRSFVQSTVHIFLFIKSRSNVTKESAYFFSTSS